MCADKHNNFIGLKDVPAPIAIFRNPTPLMQATAANSGHRGPSAHQSFDGAKCLLGHTRNFVQTAGGQCCPPLWFGPVPLMSTMYLENCEHQSIRRRQRQLFRLGERRGATQLVAGLRRCSSGLASGTRGSRPSCVFGVHRATLARYQAEEPAGQARNGPGF